MHCYHLHALRRHDHPFPRTSIIALPTPLLHLSQQFARGDLHNEQCLGHVLGGEDETKYIQQGAKPKKKRRAPAPPTPQPGRASPPQEPEPPCSGAQEQPQSSGEQTSATTVTSAEYYVEQSTISPSESEETSVTVSEVATEVQLEAKQSNNSLATSEESTGEIKGITPQEVPGQLINELAPAAGEETAELVTQDLTAEQNNSQVVSANSAAPTEESVETETGENELTTAERSAGDIDQGSTSESIIHETEIVHQDRSDTVENIENEIPSANEVELPLQGSIEIKNTRESEEYVSVSSVEETSVIMENGTEESPLRIEQSENSNSQNGVIKEYVYTKEEESDGNKSLNEAPLENGFGGSDSEISPSKTDLIDEESKPLPKPRTILPEKPTEQDKKP